MLLTLPKRLPVPLLKQLDIAAECQVAITGSHDVLEELCPNACSIMWAKPGAINYWVAWFIQLHQIWSTVLRSVGSFLYLFLHCTRYTRYPRSKICTSSIYFFYIFRLGNVQGMVMSANEGMYSHAAQHPISRRRPVPGVMQPPL